MFILIILIALTALFNFARSAVIAVNDSELEKLAESGEKQALRLKKLVEKPNKFLSSTRSAGMLLALFGGSAAVELYADRLSELIKSAEFPVPDTLIYCVSVIAVVLVFAFFMLVFGEIVPKKLAEKNPEKNALRLSGIVSVLAAVFVPFMWLTNIVSKGVLLIFGVDPDLQDDAVTEEEILMMSDAGAESGAIDEDENRIIKNIFAFDDMTAGQICTHRTDVSVLWADDSSEEWEKTIHKTRHSVFPICGESVDNVVGILNAKDYFRLDDKSKENIMSQIVREPYFVHENMKADRLFSQMKKNDADQFAVVVDEYGGMSGIITVTDLVEELVGDFSDDEDDDSAKFIRISDNQWIIPGITDLSDVSEELDIRLPDDKYDTFGGYVISLLGEIPKDGTQVHLDSDGLSINVLEIRHHRIEKCRVAIKK